MRTHLNRSFLKGLKAQATQTRETKRAVSYGNKRTGPKMLVKGLEQRTKDYALTLVLQSVMLKNEQICKSLYFTGFFNT